MISGFKKSDEWRKMMTVLEIIMLIIGLGAVFLSFRASDTNVSSSSNIESDKEELNNISQQIKEALEDFEKSLNEKAEKIINSTDDKLSAMLNEKIMGLSEYSQQILGKMENNHSETVFLYDMLNEKEKDIKALVHDVDVAKAGIRDEIASQYQEIKKSVDTVPIQPAPVQPVPVVAPIQADILETPETLVEISDGIPDELLYNNNIVDDGSSDSHAAMYDEEIAKIEEQEQREKALQKLYMNMGISGVDAVAIEDGIEHIDHRDEIIELYNKGCSVLDISKMLEVGQGEVKLVIDMYKADGQ